MNAWKFLSSLPVIITISGALRGFSTIGLINGSSNNPSNISCTNSSYSSSISSSNSSTNISFDVYIPYRNQHDKVSYFYCSE